MRGVRHCRVVNHCGRSSARSCARLLPPPSPCTPWCHPVNTQAALRDLVDGRGREIGAIEYPEPGRRITFHPYTTPLHRIKTEDMLPLRLLTPFQAENDHHIKDTYNYVTVQARSGGLSACERTAHARDASANVARALTCTRRPTSACHAASCWRSRTRTCTRAFARPLQQLWVPSRRGTWTAACSTWALVQGCTPLLRCVPARCTSQPWSAGSTLRWRARRCWPPTR